jgi:hypothetical protein
MQTNDSALLQNKINVLNQVDGGTPKKMPFLYERVMRSQ